MTKALAFLIIALTLASQLAMAGEAEWKAHIEAALTASERGDYGNAVSRLEAALKEARAFGESDQRFVLNLRALASLYDRQSRYAEAEALYKRLLAIVEGSSGPEGLLIAEILNSLAEIYREQER